MAELFGSQSEEKEVQAIVGKNFEAKYSKSTDSFAILARYVTRDTIAEVVFPLKQVRTREINNCTHVTSYSNV